MKQRVVVQAIIGQGGQVLLLKRSQGRPGLVGKYELPGGAISNGEQPEDALRRHVEASVGISLSPDLIKLHDVLSSSSRDDRDVQDILVVYRYDATLPETSIKLGNSYNDYNRYEAGGLSKLELRDSAKLILALFFGDDRLVGDRDEVDKKTTTSSVTLLYSDGGSRGNPGPSASAYIIFDPTGLVLDKGGEYIGVTTSNQAEYQAVLMGLERAVALGIKRAEFRIDSLLVVNQLKGFYTIKNRDLWPINERIKELVRQFEAIRFVHVPRELNKDADSLVNEILDKHKEAK